MRRPVLRARLWCAEGERQLDRFFDEEDAEIAEDLSQLVSAGRAGKGVQFDDDVDPIPGAPSDRLHALPVESQARAVEQAPQAAIPLPVSVELDGIDLHAIVAFRNRLRGGFLVFRRLDEIADGAPSPVELELAGIGAQRPVAATSEKAPDRLAEGLALDVPQGAVDRAQGAENDRLALLPPRKTGGHGLPQMLGLERVLTDDECFREILYHAGGRRSADPVRQADFAHTRDTLVGFDDDEARVPPQDAVAARSAAEDRLDGSHLHGSPGRKPGTPGPVQWFGIVRPSLVGTTVPARG